MLIWTGLNCRFEVTYRRSHILVTPPQEKNYLFLPQTEFLKSNIGLFHDIPCLTIDSILSGQFHHFIHNSVVVEIIRQ